ncbi:hypothetical protein D9756_006256 [Leucocoprinus leucothites]|uniref:Uncharacterized protein n=1 Tax=Leucocoprinus leucothites TaxID=201217 RepID=A0A8H5D3K5_9AGAR|nr:hypothetical protein D9756_006256 [Leucoagaricus leucothites]
MVHAALYSHLRLHLAVLMKALRATIRPLSLARNVTTSAVCWYRPIPHLYKPLRSPYTWPARLWFRPEGTPRSKWKGVFYFAIASLFAVKLRDAVVLARKVVAVVQLVEYQRVDAKISSYDLLSPQELASYISDFLYNTRQVSRAERERFKRDMELVLATIPETHGFLQTEFEKIHDLLTKDSGLSPLEIELVLQRIMGDLGSQINRLCQESLELGIKEAREEKSNRDDVYTSLE